MAGKEYAGGPAARYLVLGAAVFLTGFGLVMIYSASSISAYVKEGTSLYWFERQLVWVALSLVFCVLAARFDYRLFRGWRGWTVWAGTGALLVATIVIGVVRGGARRWIETPFGNLQPSELAKIACVLVAAALAVEWNRRRIDTPTYFKRLLVVVGVPAFLIIIQPDLGTTVLMTVGVAIVLFLGGVELRWVALAVALVIGLGVLATVLAPFRVERVLGALNPWADPQHKGYQSVQALLAFGTGGIKGLGLGLSRQKYFYLPEAHTDFIFAIVGEEVGLIGTLTVVAGFAVLLISGFRIAMGSRDLFGRLVAGSLTGMLAFQAALNMAAVTGIFPVTGKPLPFMSFGGSSMLVTMISVGLILSVSEYGARAPRAVRSASRAEERVRANPDEWRRDGGARLPRPGGRRAIRRGA